MIEIRKLKKSFGGREVLKEIDLDVKRGQVTALIGPNGSGKTTLVKCILGLVIPDSGEILIKGINIKQGWSYRKEIGYMPQIPRFPENLKARELMEMMAGIRNNGIHSPSDPAKSGLVTAFQLEELLDKPVRTLSGGSKQKLSAMLALSPDPEMLILDEPTISLDPLSSISFKKKILKEKGKGKAILLSSHIMSEVEELADTVVFLHEGKKYFQGGIREIKQKTSGAGGESLEKAIAKMMESLNAKRG